MSSSIDSGASQAAINLEYESDASGYLADTETPQSPKKKKVTKSRSAGELTKSNLARVQQQYMNDKDNEGLDPKTVGENQVQEPAEEGSQSAEESYVDAGDEQTSSSFTNIGTDDGTPVIEYDTEGRAVEYKAEDSPPPKASFGEGLRRMGKTFFPPKG